VAPYSLLLGNDILARVVAINAYGDSVVSAIGGGAVILLTPDAPVSLANIP
jgi:hypothetical protein